MKKFVSEPARQVPVRAEVDVLVAGGGPSGIMAAQAASDGKKKVMLIESRGFLGGNLTIGLPILAFLGPKKNHIIKGYPQKFIDRLAERGAASGHKPCHLHTSFTMVDCEEVKNLAFEVMEECGVDVLLYAFIVDAIVEDGVVKGVIIESKAGREAILAKTVIDCTGDADVAYRAGVVCDKGDENGGMQPPTLMFNMRGVKVQELRDAIVNQPEVYDMDRMPKEQFIEGHFITVGLRNQLIKAREDGLDLPVARTILITGLAEDEIWVNMTRVSGVDSTLPESYTYGEQTAHKQLKKVAEYLQKYVPGFSEAWVDKVAPFMGIRESRVIRGKYILTVDDIVSLKRFEDVVAVAGYPVDIHHASGGDCTMIYCDDSYDLPYRVLVPETVGGLLVAGRCSSMDHGAMAATRVMSTCMALGQAAGTAARLAIDEGVAVADVDVKALQEELLKNDAFLG